MYKILYILSLLPIFLMTMSNAYAQNKTNVEYDASNTTRLKVGGYIQVELIEGDKEKVVFSASEEVKKLIKIKARKGRLSILAKQKYLKSLSPVKPKIKVYYKHLKALKVRNGAKLTGQHLIKAKYFDLVVIEGAYVTLKLQTKDLKARVSTGADVALSGTTDTFEAKVKMGSMLDAYTFKSNVCFVRTSMGANAKVFARELLRMSAGMGSSIKYEGNPKQIAKSSSWMGGNIEKQQ
ncbi:head GIN domain-containing protein [Microscilla marina]|uniref:Putative auto-transporter adhesin head GIN domain-containing protein n=1 Tax=Microscilla marina ATCC 23134 TaxID=313606 RepID=A1ZUU2_MICM2|nr:head GIN domain-containing protein [Microscilla marina]EAY25846.1 hypothetical protein M23134_07658 [Microscilla marina ATCC 23134]